MWLRMANLIRYIPNFQYQKINYNKINELTPSIKYKYY